MMIKKRIQPAKTIDLSQTLIKDVKKHKKNVVKWIINKENNQIQIELIHCDNITQQTTENEHNIILYRRIHSSSSITIPKIVFERLNCKIYDKIILNITDKITVTSTKKITLKDLSGIITKQGE